MKAGSLHGSPCRSTRCRSFLQHWGPAPQNRPGVRVSRFFKLNNAHPPRAVPGGFYRRAWAMGTIRKLPVPTIGIESAPALLCENLMLEITGQGNWVNHWDSLRSEKWNGPIYRSRASKLIGRPSYYKRGSARRSSVSRHRLLLFTSRPRIRIRSANLIRLQSFGPEIRRQLQPLDDGFFPAAPSPFSRRLRRGSAPNLMYISRKENRAGPWFKYLGLLEIDRMTRLRHHR